MSKNVDAVAPLIATPSANQTYANVVPVVQVPGTAVNVEPTRNVPDTVGTLEASARSVLSTMSTPDFSAPAATVTVDVAHPLTRAPLTPENSAQTLYVPGLAGMAYAPGDPPAPVVVAPTSRSAPVYNETDAESAQTAAPPVDVSLTRPEIVAACPTLPTPADVLAPAATTILVAPSRVAEPSSHSGA